MVKVRQTREELADREAIRECLYRDARGVDRLDADMLRTAYRPDAIDTHLGFWSQFRPALPNRSC